MSLPLACHIDEDLLVRRTGKYGRAGTVVQTKGASNFGGLHCWVSMFCLGVGDPPAQFPFLVDCLHVREMVLNMVTHTGSIHCFQHYSHRIKRLQVVVVVLC